MSFSLVFSHNSPITHPLNSAAMYLVSGNGAAASATTAASAAAVAAAAVAAIKETTKVTTNKDSLELGCTSTGKLPNFSGMFAVEHKLRVQDAENEKSEHVSTEKKKSLATEKRQRLERQKDQRAANKAQKKDAVSLLSEDEAEATYEIVSTPEAKARRRARRVQHSPVRRLRHEVFSLSDDECVKDAGASKAKAEAILSREVTAPRDVNRSDDALNVGDIAAGAAVVVVGLVNADHHNGKQAVVVCLDVPTGRFVVELECGTQIRIKPYHLQLAGAGMTDEEVAGTVVIPSADNVLEQMFCDDGAQSDNIDAQQQREAAEEYRERRRGVEAAVAAAQEASRTAADGAGRTRDWTDKQKLALSLFGEGRSLALLGFAGTGKTVRCRAHSLVRLNHADVCTLTVVCRPLSWRCCDVLRAKMPLG